jgi:hypothetical protein
MVKLINEEGVTCLEMSAAEARLVARYVGQCRRGNAENFDEKKLRTKVEQLLACIKSVKVSEKKEYATNGLTADILADMYTVIENQQCFVTHVFMSARRYSDLRKWNRDILDIETDLYKLRAGFMAMLWGADIVIVSSEVVPEDEVVIVSDSRGVGNKREYIFARWAFKFEGLPPAEFTKMERMLDDVVKRLGAIETLLASIREDIP